MDADKANHSALKPKMNVYNTLIIIIIRSFSF